MTTAPVQGYPTGEGGDTAPLTLLQDKGDPEVDQTGVGEQVLATFGPFAFYKRPTTGEPLDENITDVLITSINLLIKFTTTVTANGEAGLEYSMDGGSSWTRIITVSMEGNVTSRWRSNDQSGNPFISTDTNSSIQFRLMFDNTIAGQTVTIHSYAIQAVVVIP
jgi:hypothetical protein